jgi:hypothetical protein
MCIKMASFTELYNTEKNDIYIYIYTAHVPGCRIKYIS